MLSILHSGIFKQFCFDTLGYCETRAVCHILVCFGSSPWQHIAAFTNVKVLITLHQYLGVLQCLWQLFEYLQKDSSWLAFPVLSLAGHLVLEAWVLCPKRVREMLTASKRDELTRMRELSWCNRVKSSCFYNNLNWTALLFQGTDLAVRHVLCHLFIKDRSFEVSFQFA